MYLVKYERIEMAVSVKDIAENYPLPSYNYMVSIGHSIPLLAGVALTVGEEWVAFSEISGLDVEYDTLTYKHGLSYAEGPVHVRTRRKPANFTLKRGIVRGRNRLTEWITTINLPIFMKKNILIVLCDENGNPVVSWRVLNAFPIKLEAPQFVASENDVAIESLTVMADYVKLEYH